MLEIYITINFVWISHVKYAMNLHKHPKGLYSVLTTFVDFQILSINAYNLLAVLCGRRIAKMRKRERRTWQMQNPTHHTSTSWYPLGCQSPSSLFLTSADNMPAPRWSIFRSISNPLVVSLGHTTDNRYASCIAWINTTIEHLGCTEHRLQNNLDSLY